MEKIKDLFCSFNRVQSDAHEVFFNSIIDFKYTDIEVKKFVDKSKLNWETDSLKELGGISPKEFIKGINDKGYLLNMLKEGSIICDDGLPNILIDHIIKKQDILKKELYNIVEGNLKKSKEERIFIQGNTIKIISKKEFRDKKKVAELLINVLKIYKDNDYIMETIAKGLRNIGIFTIEPIIKRLYLINVTETERDTLISTLSFVAMNKKSEKVYNALIETFKKTKNKELGAVCLLQYGDKRAALMLSVYLKNNQMSLKNSETAQINVTIKALRGEI